MSAAAPELPGGEPEVGLGHPVGLTDHAQLAALTSSLATVGGALGAGLETDEAVRDAAYTQWAGDDGSG